MLTTAVDNAATIKPDAASLAKLSLDLAETYKAAKKAALAELGPKNVGYDVKIMRKIISLRRMDRDKRREEEEILELYLAALGEA